MGRPARASSCSTIAKSDARWLFWDEGLSNDLSDIGDWGMPGGSGLMCIKYVYTPEENYYNTDGSVKVNTFNSADFPSSALPTHSLCSPSASSRG